MDADWEVEIGGGAPVIEAAWPGFIDLRAEAHRIREIAEAISFPPLARLLTVLNSASSPWWTSKCDFWQPEPFTCACYVDLLPRATSVFADWHDAENACRTCVTRINKAASGAGKSVISSNALSFDSLNRPLHKEEPEISINLVVRAAVAKNYEGFGITAYMSARASSSDDANAALAHAMDIVTDALLTPPLPTAPPER